ncbi:hypothetical protein Tco_0784643 [Tanacetum coccineum]
MTEGWIWCSSKGVRQLVMEVSDVVVVSASEEMVVVMESMIAAVDEVRDLSLKTRFPDGQARKQDFRMLLVVTATVTRGGSGGSSKGVTARVMEVSDVVVECVVRRWWWMEVLLHPHLPEIILTRLEYG